MEIAGKKATDEEEQWTASSSSAITNLPSHILMEILFKLPIKTLVATKSVCKSWLHLIQDPQFSKLHQARAKVEVCLQSYFEDDLTLLYMGSFHSLNDSHSLDIKLNTLFHLPNFKVSSNNTLTYDATMAKPCFVNSCNGLLCYFGIGISKKSAVIWNPITSEFVTFPAPYEHNGMPTYRACGLGFSQKNNRFKLLRAMDRKESSKQVNIVAEICTIEKGCSWRTVGTCPYSSWKPYSPYPLGLVDQWIGTFLQGSIHWVCEDSHDLGLIIVSFNFDDEKFGTVPLPPHFKNKKFCYLDRDRIGVFVGCLFITDNTNEGVNIWLMKEYGVQDSWTEIISLQLTTIDERWKFTCYIPIDYVDNGEILMRRIIRDRTDLFMYNPVLKSMKIIGSGPRFLTVNAFNPSLILLKDSMMGYDVHAISRCADSEYRDMATTPNWWRSMTDLRTPGGVGNDGDGAKTAKDFGK